MNKSHPKGYRAKVLVVDDHAVVRSGMVLLVSRQADLIVCGEAEDAAGALAAIATKKPDIIVVDLRLKNSDGLELVKNIKAQYPALPMLVFSMHEESVYAEQALRAGACGYLMKDEALESLVTAIRRVVAGGIYLSERMASSLLQHQVRGRTDAGASPLDRLTDRELQVLQLIGRWHTTRQIAQQLHLSIKTVEHYREQIKAKLGLTSAAELVQYGVCWAQGAPPSGSKAAQRPHA